MVITNFRTNRKKAEKKARTMWFRHHCRKVIRQYNRGMMTARELDDKLEQLSYELEFGV